VSPSAKVVFNVLYWWDYWAWASELREPDFHNVILDMHLYTAFEGFTAATPDLTVLRAAHSFHCRCLAHAWHHPAVIGEWSLAIDAEATKVTQAYADAQLTAFQASLGWFFWNLKMDTQAPLAMRGATGATIGSSPQWDFIKAVDETPNVDGMSNQTSSYDFPHLGHYMPAAPGATNIGGYCTADTPTPPPGLPPPPAPPARPPTPPLPPTQPWLQSGGCAAYTASYGCGWLHPDLCLGARANRTAWLAHTSAHPDGSPFACCCAPYLEGAGPLPPPPGPALPLQPARGHLTVDSVGCPSLSLVGLLLLLTSLIVALCACCTWLPFLKRRFRLLGDRLVCRTAAVAMRKTRSLSVVDKSHHDHQTWLTGASSALPKTKRRGRVEDSLQLLGELQQARVRLAEAELHASTMETELGRMRLHAHLSHSSQSNLLAPGARSSVESSSFKVEHSGELDHRGNPLLQRPSSRSAIPASVHSDSGRRISI